MGIISKTNISKARKIGLVSATKGAGVTHTALAIANYCHSCLGENVNYIEVTQKSRLANVVCKKEVSVGNHIAYKYKGVKYFVACSINEARELINTLKGTIIVDIAEINESTSQIYSICKTKIILGSFKPWKQEEVIEFFNKKIQKTYDTKTLLFLGIGINEKEKREFKKNFNCIVFERPEIYNPMCIRESELKSIKKILDV